MEIKVLDSYNQARCGFARLNKAELFTSDLRGAFVMAHAKERLMLLLAVQSISIS